MDIEDLHAGALARGARTYTDPETGFAVFTSAALADRGRCCGCGCRHCPYGHEMIPMAHRPAKIRNPAMLHGSLVDAREPVDLLLWSGGKDSFLAARALTRERGRGHLALLTTFDAASRRVAHQEVDIAAIVRQAEALDVPLLGVPLSSAEASYTDRLGAALDFAAAERPIARVCTGDLHLEHIRAWRLSHIKPLADRIGASLHDPLWRTSYADLLADLEVSATPCRICALGDNGRESGAAVGDAFDASLLDRLDPACDAFGENGEFHSLAEVWDGPDDPLTHPFHHHAHPSSRGA